MWLVVGLGNPGSKYALTRHNIGFMALDLWAEGYNARNWKEEHRAHTTRITLKDTQVLLVKPMTYMNLSGESVQALMNFYKIDLDKLIVVHDDIDQDFNKIKLHKNRGHGGHNGIRDITEKLSTADYMRVKLGVGRPTHPSMQVADYVLQRFSEQEQSELSDFLNRSGDAIESIIFDGLSKASTKFN